jgi:hypothetical protein
VFGDRYKAVLVEGEQRYDYQTLMDYIHFNPVRARIVPPVAKQSVLDDPWSSAANAVQPLRRLDRRKAQARIPSERRFFLEEAEQAKT